MTQAFRRSFAPRIFGATTVQETAFVLGMSGAKLVAAKVKEKIGGEKRVDYCIDYASAFVSGAAGSLVGHPANTALTRWQNGMTLSPNQAMWGSLRKARAVGVFAVGCKAGKDLWKTVTEAPNK